MALDAPSSSDGEAPAFLEQLRREFMLRDATYAFAGGALLALNPHRPMPPALHSLSSDTAIAAGASLAPPPHAFATMRATEPTAPAAMAWSRPAQSFQLVAR